MNYRFLVKLLYQGKLRILTVMVSGECDAIGVIEAAQEIIFGSEDDRSLAATQLVSVERISDA